MIFLYKHKVKTVYAFAEAGTSPHPTYARNLFFQNVEILVENFFLGGLSRERSTEDHPP